MSGHDSSGSIVRLRATQLSTAILRREVSCREVMSAYLDQIERYNPRVNALVSLQSRDSMLEQADERDREVAAGQVRGSLHGFPLAPKDLTNTIGITTTQGSPLLRTFVPSADAIIVERMRSQGAILIGKSNTSEFGLGSHTYNTVFGTTRNAWDPTRSAGGSSGGAAVALALEMLPVADGTDMMGSLRNPAGWNNVFGFRPSFGRVPSGPTSEVFMQQLNSEGPMGRNVPDVAMFLSVLAGFDERAPLSNPQNPAALAQLGRRDFKGTRIGWLGDFGGYLPMEPGVKETCKGTLKHFETLGCIIEEAHIDFSMERLWEAWLTLRSFLIVGKVGSTYSDPEQRAQLKPELVWEIEHGLKLSAADVWSASVDRSAWYQALVGAFKRWDFLVLPTAQVWPFDASLDWPKKVGDRHMDTYHRWMEVSIPGTLAGLPVLAAPAGFSPGGLPMGIQIIGRAHADLSVLEIGHAYDQASSYTRRHPPMLGRIRNASAN